MCTYICIYIYINTYIQISIIECSLSLSLSVVLLPIICLSFGLARLLLDRDVEEPADHGQELFLGARRGRASRETVGCGLVDTTLTAPLLLYPPPRFPKSIHRLRIP